MKLKILSVRAATMAALLLVSLAVVNAASSEEYLGWSESLPKLEIHLPEGQGEVSRSFQQSFSDMALLEKNPSGEPSLRFAVLNVLTAAGSGPFELVIRLDGQTQLVPGEDRSFNWRFELIDNVSTEPTMYAPSDRNWEPGADDHGGLTELEYRQILGLKQGSSWKLRHDKYEYVVLGYQSRAGSKSREEKFDDLRVLRKNTPPDMRAFTLTVTLRRINYCTMWAKVSGDANLVTSGDLAHYNLVDERNPGGDARLDQQWMEVMGGFVEGLGEMMDEAATTNPDFVAGSLGQDQDGNGESNQPRSEPGQYTQQARQQLNEFNQWVSEGRSSDNFSLSLSNFKAPEGEPDLAAVRGLMQMTGAFTLGATGVVDDDHVAVTRLEVSPGQRDGSGNRIRYVWEPGKEGSASINTILVSDGIIAGIVIGELYTGKPPFKDGRRLRIEVEAQFVALRGQLSCLASH